MLMNNGKKLSFSYGSFRGHINKLKLVQFLSEMCKPDPIQLAQRQYWKKKLEKSVQIWFNFLIKNAVLRASTWKTLENVPCGKFL